MLLALFILLVRTVWCLGANTTTIEGWEIERHATLVRRARYLGGFLDGPNGTKIRITKQEFPYDIGIYANLAQGMGGHIHKWLWPFASTPTAESGLQFPENDIEGMFAWRSIHAYHDLTVARTQSQEPRGLHLIQTVCFAS